MTLGEQISTARREILALHKKNPTLHGGAAQDFMRIYGEAQRTIEQTQSRLLSDLRGILNRMKTDVAEVEPKPSDDQK